MTNALISTPEDLDFRMQLRNEFMRVGLLDVLEVEFVNRLADVKYIIAVVGG